MISPLAHIDPQAKIGDHCVIYPFAYIEEGTEIGDHCTVMPYASILKGTRLGNHNKICQGAVLGAVPQDFNFSGDDSLVMIGDYNTIREHVVVNRATYKGEATRIGSHNFLMEGAHISHDVQLGDHCVIGYGTKIAGDSIINDHVISSGGVLVHPGCRLGSWSLIQSGSLIYKDVPPYVIVGKNPAAYYNVNAVVLAHKNFPEATIRRIARAYRLIYCNNNTIEDALRKIEQQIPMSDEIRYMVDFIRESEKGIIR